ncbi:Uncharacterised protein [Mycobacteroides abscessus subsp. abscessus]|nr:Uncharacterised protein [Mycobacteroides abscessus subsp. abscessus]
MKRSSRCTQLRRACALRRRRSLTSACSAAASGTTRLAASVGVAARRSATRSHSGLSGSCPTALTTGVVQAAISRHSVSSENGSRSSTLPPPRAITMTSTCGAASRARRASTICGTALVPCTAVFRMSKWTAGQRLWATVTTSCSAADARPVMRPMVLGRNGIGRFIRGSNNPSASSSRRSRSMRASSSPMPTARIWLMRNENEPLRV